MLVGQFKELKSELTRGNAYSQKNYHRGLKKTLELIIFLAYLGIYGTINLYGRFRKNYGWKQL
jgi:hypothetical protein